MQILTPLTKLKKCKYRSSGIRYQVSMVPVTVLKEYRGSLVHGTAYLCEITMFLGGKLRLQRQTQSEDLFF